MANPFCPGIAGIVSAYQTAIRQVELWGPTNFAPIIRRVSSYAAEADSALTANPRGKQVYHLILIITDGAITDMEDTKEAIVAASNMPLSIIIVGVGSADFTLMNALDSDDVRFLYTSCAVKSIL